jgi:putative DNA primase/helicase
MSFSSYWVKGFTAPTEEEWCQHLAGFQADATTWDTTVLGAKPGNNGCHCPPELLAKFGYPTVILFPPRSDTVINGADHGGKPKTEVKPPRLRPLDLHAFFKLDLKPREMVLKPIIPEKGLAMLYALRGTGKTFFALGVAYAVATGTSFLKWNAPKGRRVLLIDGEMPAVALKERLEQIERAAVVKPETDMLKIIAGDLIEDGGVGNLADPVIQAELNPFLEGIELLILDNLSSLTAIIRDNDADSWNTIQAWLLQLRRRGISVLIIHHAGKGGQQRGTSRREDVLDTSISLRRPIDYAAEEGARFEVHIEKGRGILGDDAKPFEARLQDIDGKQAWTMRAIEDEKRALVAALLGDGLSVRGIARETGLTKSVVGRLRQEVETKKQGKAGE